MDSPNYNNAFLSPTGYERPEGFSRSGGYSRPDADSYNRQAGYGREQVYGQPAPLREDFMDHIELVDETPASSPDEVIEVTEYVKSEKPRRRFQSYRLKGPYERPWLTDPRMKKTRWNNWIVRGFFALGIALSGFICYSATLNVGNNEVCHPPRSHLRTPS